MSAGTFTDSQGNTYIVGPDNKLTPVRGGGKTPVNPTAQASTQAPGAIATLGLGALAGQALSGGGAEAAGSALGTATPALLGGVDAGLAEIPSGWDLEGIGAPGNYILPTAGLAAGYDLWANKPQRVGTRGGYAQGAAAGALAGSYFGPVGAGVGAGVGLLANAFGIGGKSRTKVEEARRKALAERGIIVPNGDTRDWENNTNFAQSRDEAALTGKDIMHSAALYELGGYDKLDAAKQEAIANEAIKQGLVREHHKTIDIGMNDAYKKFVEDQMKAATPTTTNSTRVQSDPRIEKERKRAQVAQILPELESSPTKAPRYDMNISSLMSNPYL